MPHEVPIAIMPEAPSPTGTDQSIARDVLRPVPTYNGVSLSIQRPLRIPSPARCLSVLPAWQLMLALCLSISVLTMWIILVGLNVLSREAAGAIPNEVYMCAVIYSVLAAVIAIIAVAGYCASRAPIDDNQTVNNPPAGQPPSICSVAA